jgi:lysyl-tRNA synthetase, class II
VAIFPRVNKLPPERLLAAAAFAVGGVSILSGFDPQLAERSDFISGLLLPGVPERARILAFVLGLALLWISAALTRRRRNAWRVAALLVVVVGATHLVQGLDAEVGTATLVLLVSLLLVRSRFDWPCRHEVTQSEAERRMARALVQSHGRGSLDFFALRRDKSYFFSQSGRAFLAFRVVAGTALISGDLVGDRVEFTRLLSDFTTTARANGWRVGMAGASEELLPAYREAGLRSFEIGQEAVVRPADFSLEGRPIRKVRQSVNRLVREGYSARILGAEEVGAREREQLEEVSAEWLGAWPDRGFSMAMDLLFAEPGPVFVAAEREGRIDGFLQLVPAGEGYSLSAMRRRGDTPNGLMEFLIAEALAWAREGDVAEVSLNFCAFGDVLREECRSPFVRFLRFCLRRLDRFFQLERLLSFNRKFFPDWRPRYLCYERLTDLPAVAFAYLHAESLLTPPRPWARERKPALAA